MIYFPFFLFAFSLPQEVTEPQHGSVQLPRAPSLSVAAKPFPVNATDLAYGENLWRETGCLACHAPSGIASLSTRADVQSLAEFLGGSPPSFGAARSFPHDFGLDFEEAIALSAFLLRSQYVSAEEAPPQPGLAWECYEIQIEEESLPSIEGKEPAAYGTTDFIGVDVRTRDNHFLLRFQSKLFIPEKGDWTFHLGSDDSSWLWLDGEQVIRNEALAPMRVVSETRNLSAGFHLFEVRMTEAAGEELIELKWEGPGFPEPIKIPTENFQVQREALIPPPFTPDNSRNLGAPNYRAMLETGDSVADRMQRDGCLSCHTRSGRGGLPEEARIAFVGEEDLGFEGQLPPSLDGVGHRLRESWIRGHLTGAQRARPYLRARCVEMGEEEANQWANLFADTDATADDDTDPVSSESSVERGQVLAGNQGKNCIACHRVAGQDGPAIQGMDLAIQYERMKPDWFLEWLESPAVHRPGTRMPTFWPLSDRTSQADREALWAWTALGAAMPLPEGLVVDADAYDLEPGQRTLLHGCSLSGLSARCLAVGTPKRTHYAYDLEHLQLRWLWRGAFLNVEGTWRGRNLVELSPAGMDHVVLDSAFPFQLPGAPKAEPHLLGWRLDSDGWPLFRIQLGDVEIQDTMRPRWTAGGSAFVRTLRVIGGAVNVNLPAGDGVRLTPALPFLLQDGDSQEVVYQW